MTKKVFALFLPTLFTVNILNAQVRTNENLLRVSAGKLGMEQVSNYARAMALAKEKKWELSILLSNGNHARLTGVDEFGFPVYTRSYNNTIAAATTRANQLWPGGSSGFNLSGSTPAMQNKLGIWEYDGAPLKDHVEFSGRIVQKDAPAGRGSDFHATHVAGTMIAKGINPIAKGMAFDIPNLISYDNNSDLSEMTSEAASGMLLSNHSYGLLTGWNYNTSNTRWEFYGRVGENEDYRYGYYSREASLVDSILYNAPYYLMVQSAGNDRNNNGPDVGQPYYRYDASNTMISAGNRPAGISSNDGYDIIAGKAIAKNNITIGAVRGIAAGYNKPSDVVMSAFSAWGPTDDGRIKPDFVADGVNVTSTTSTGNSAYATLSGTSMAAPNTTGSLLLLQELYTKLKPGSFMRSATLKGLAIHTTDEAGLSEGPDYQYGWGLLNVGRAAAVLNNAISLNNATTSNDLVYENVLTSGTSFTKTVVASGKGPLKATIAWTDPVGSVNTNASTNLNDRTKKLVHDLDIRITRATQTFSPWTLSPLSPASDAVRGDNITDNVERIDVDSTIPGEVYTITVSNKGALVRGTQAYSLIISGAGGTAYCDSKSTPGGGPKIDSVRFSNIQFGSTAGCKSYTNNTNITGDIQARQTVPFSIKVSTCDGTTNSRMVKIFIDYNNDGDFLDAGELAATSGVLSSATVNYTDNIVVPDNVITGNLTRMRVIVQETLNASDISPCNDFAKGETQDFNIRIVAPSNDMALSNIVSPDANGCANDAQYLTVSITNNGSVAQSNIPLTATIKNGATTVATLTATYPGTIAPLSSVNYTFQQPFNSVAGTTYTITAVVSLTTDQNSSNNQFTATVPIAAKPAAPAGQGVVCGNNVLLSALNPGTANYYWYTGSTGGSPIGYGASIQTSNITSDRTYYLATDTRASIGAVSKLTYPSGGYNNFAGNFMTFQASVPLTIETVRLYIGNPGQIRFTVGNNLTTSGNTGSYTYRPLASTTIDVYATKPNPAPGSVSGNSPADSGAVFALNLPVPVSGEGFLMVECLNDATIFRNNGISGTIYPTMVSNLFSFTGNSASLDGTTNANGFYYFFYDTRVSTGCASDRVPVIAAANSNVTLSQVGDSLVSSIRNGFFQWVYNDTASVSGANGSSIKPTKSGNYKVIVTDALGCAKTSANINYTVTGIVTASPEEIKLNVSPNPNNGVFQLSFEVSNRSDLSIEILNASGQRVYVQSQSGFIGRYSKQINLPRSSSEFYLLKIQHHKKTYLQKILIMR
ncbi:MAG: S8 family peptidase [Sediminibacterium sp.]|nr:S8 family peptidase [Sediminibacterium sp.]